MKRCGWAPLDDPIYLAYHDREWGVPSHDDRHLFEMLTLEGAQAGLSWSTILKKRDGYRRAFAGFDPAKVARFDASKIERLMKDPGIVRNRLKVESAVANARATLDVRRQFGSLDAYLWSFVGGSPKVSRFRKITDIPSETPESKAMSEDLKRRGFRFVGPTVCYAFMQAAGLVNDHEVTCFRYRGVADQPQVMRATAYLATPGLESCVPEVTGRRRSLDEERAHATHRADGPRRRAPARRHLGRGPG